VCDRIAKLQIRPLVKDGALHEQTITCQNKEYSKSGHGPPKFGGGASTPRRNGRLTVYAL
jgi:hypothetical protein